jgi:hypothetical protein
MSLRLSLVSLVASLSLAAFACNTEPQRADQGTVAIDLFDADGSVTLSGLDSAVSERITLKAGESRVAHLPAGLYSVEFTPDVLAEPGSVQLGTGPQVIVVAAERVTTVQIESELADADSTRMASIEVW